MKNLFFILVSILFFSFTESEEVVFKSIDGKTNITAADVWTAAGNMKGVEIFISRENAVTNTTSTVVVSKDENLLEGTSLSSYSAGKLFLQTAVLNTTPSVIGTKSIGGQNFKYYEYEYDNKDLIKMKTLVYHTLVGTTGYQMVITAANEGFEQARPLYNEIANSLKLSN